MVSNGVDVLRLAGNVGEFIWRGGGDTGINVDRALGVRELRPKVLAGLGRPAA